MIPAEQGAAEILLEEIVSKMNGSTNDDRVFTFCSRSPRLTKVILCIRN